MNNLAFCKQDLFSLFAIFVSFIPPSGHIVWTGAVGKMVNRSGESGQSYLVFDLRGKESNTS